MLAAVLGALAFATPLRTHVGPVRFMAGYSLSRLAGGVRCAEEPQAEAPATAQDAFLAKMARGAEVRREPRRRRLARPRVRQPATARLPAENSRRVPLSTSRRAG